MPYIAMSRRADFFKLESLITQTRIDNAGELNYLVTQLFLKYIGEHGLRYQSINDCLGAAEGAKLEVYRRVAAKLEDKKCTENGDVFDVFDGEFDGDKEDDDAVNEG
jgi:hypothetical protein